MFTSLFQRLTSKNRATRRRQASQRRLRLERLDKRELLAGDINAISGTTYDDLTGDGLTADDPRLAGIQVRLYRDGGDGVLGGDDVVIDTVTTDASGNYLFDDLAVGRYYVEQLNAPAGMLIPDVVAVDVARHTTQVIDGFDITPVNLLVDAGSSTATSNEAAPEAVGGRRKIELTYDTGPSSVSIEVNTLNQRLAMNSDNESRGHAVLRYDGDGSGLALNPTGLGSINLDDGSIKSGLLLQVFRNLDVVGQTYSLVIYSDADHYSVVDRLFDPTIINANYDEFVPFTAFSTGTGAAGPADFSNVGAIELYVENVADQNIRVSLFEAIAPSIHSTDLQNLQDSADLAVSKTLIDTVTNADGSRTATFQVDVTNHGVMDAAGVQVTDSFPAGMSYLSTGTVGNPGLPAGVVQNVTTVGSQTTFDLGDLGNGQSVSFLVITTIAAGTSGDLENTVTVTSERADNNPDNNTDTEIVAAPKTELSIDKSLEDANGQPIDGTVATGDTIVYRLVAHNGGPDDASGVTVVDTLPAGVTFVSATLEGSESGVSYDATSRTVTANVGGLANGGQAVILIRVKVDSNAASQLVNEAEIANQPNTDTDLSNNRDEVTVGVDRVVDLAISKQLAAGQTPSYGGVVTYQITVSNLSSSPGDARGFTVTDVLPAGLSYVAGSFAAGTSGVTIDASGQNLTFAGVPLEIGDSVTFTFDVNVAQEAAASLVNTANVAPINDGQLVDIDRDLSNNQDDVSIDPARAIDLVVGKDDGIDEGDFATPGQPIVYTITVTNNGVSDATNVNVTDTLPSGVVATSITIDGANVTDNNPDQGILSFVIPTVAAGETVTVLVGANIGAALTGSITNTVTISASGDPEEGNTASVTTALQPDLDVRIDKSGPASAIPGGPAITYTLTVTNDGPSAAAGAVVTDSLPAGLTLQSITQSGTAVTNTGSGNDIEFTIAQLSPGESNALTYTIVATIDPAATAELVNTATVTTPGDNDPSNNTSEAVTTTLTPEADLGVTKSVSAAQAQPGDQLTYTIVVTNHGLSTAQGVTLVDVLPSGVTFVSGTGPGGTALTASGQNVNRDIGTLAPGDSQTFTILATVDEGTSGTLTNQVTVATTTSEGNDTNPNTASASTTATIPDPNNAGLSGRVFVDHNNDGLFDPATDRLLGGVTVQLLDAGTSTIVASTTTDTDGQWAFANLAAGSYDVRVIRPAGLTDGMEHPGDGRPVSNLGDSTIPGLTLAQGQTIGENDFGLIEALSKRRFIASAYR